MANAETLKWLSAHGLATRVVAALADVSDWARARGVSLAVFGSFATGRTRPGSDLDLAIVVRSGASASTLRELAQRVDQLPTIRSVDLVDLQSVSERFRRAALAEAKPL